MNILLTGPPRIGKTTVIKRIIEIIGINDTMGFWSEEIREHGKRVGFGIMTTLGESGILAHVSLKEGPRVSKYHVNVADINHIIVPVLRRAVRSNKIIIIDEIAKMELFSKEFADAVIECLNTGNVIGTIQLRRDLFLEQIRGRPDCMIINVTHANRDTLPMKILEIIQRHE